MARLQKRINDLESWCLNNGEFGKQLMNEWTGGCEDGNTYKIDEVTKASNKKFKWKCSKGHEWYAALVDRTSQKQGCPYCSGHRVSNGNSLKTWCLNNSLFGKQLIKEWTGECDDGSHYKIDEVARASRKIFKWRCSKGHEWFAKVNGRTSHKSGCPYCSRENNGKLIAKAMLSEENSLKTWCMNNDSFGKQLISEWTGICEDNRHYEIDEVARASNKKFKWICSKGHEWISAIQTRTSNKSGCPYCFKNSQSEIASKAKLSEKNSLKTWCLSNGSFGKQLMSEWVGDCENGKHYKIDEVARASGKKFKWKCSKGHEWLTTVNIRTYQKQGCPYCNTHRTSYPEQFIYHSLKQIYPSAENRCKVLKSQQNTRGIEFDIGVPEIPLCIEYSSTYWHKGREEKDQYKKDLCEQCGVRLIQIIDDSYNELEHITSDDYICFKMNYSQQDEILEVIVDYILNSLGHSISEIDIERVKQEAYENSKGTEKDIQDTD